MKMGWKWQTDQNLPPEPETSLNFHPPTVHGIRSRSIRMKAIFCKGLIAAAVLVLGGGFALAQSGGDAVYKAKCQSCHGATGTPSPAMAKAMNVKPASDPSVKSKSEAAMIELTKKGVGKMPAYAGKLTDGEIKSSVEYFRTLAK